ncbi:MAG: COQ9 family protein [Rhodospirillales bacterium]
MSATPPDITLPDMDRDEIVRAMLVHVAFEGWTGKAVSAALADLGLPEEAARLAFPGGMVEMISHWSALLDRQMEGEMVAAVNELAALSPPERIARAVRLRLDACRPDREAVRRAIAYLALPLSQPKALRITYETIDAIWYAAGDRSTDFSYYTRRAMLAAVYAATVMFWLDDESEGNEATWAFLDRRLHDVLRAHRLRRRITDALGGLVPSFAIFRPRHASPAAGPPAADSF